MSLRRAGSLRAVLASTGDAGLLLKDTGLHFKPRVLELGFRKRFPEPEKEAWGKIQNVNILKRRRWCFPSYFVQS